MPAATVIKRDLATLGPFKIELIHISAPNTGETVQCLMANPRYAFASAASVTGQIANPSAQINGKVITLGANDGAADIALMVVGE